MVEKDTYEGVTVKHVRLLFSDGSGQRRCRVSGANISLRCYVDIKTWIVTLNVT